mgnify:CR=1 FL=1|jgi:hypothetical protein
MKKNLVTSKVGIKSGRGNRVRSTKTDRDLLNESLPSGVSIGMNDIIASDVKSAVINKENDL